MTTPVKRLAPPKREQSIVVGVRMPLTLVKQIDRIAKRDERTRSKLIEIAARTYVEGKAA